MLTLVFKDLGQTLVELSISLGTDTQAALDYVFPGGKINLAGLDAEGIDKAVSEFISSAADTAVDAVFGEMLKGYQKVGEGLFETAIRLVADKEIVLDALRMTGQAFVGTIPQIIAFSEAIIDMAGGLDNLTESAGIYFDAFFSDAEKQARLQEQLSESLEGINFELPDSRAGFRGLVEALDLTTEAGQRAYVTLLNLAQGADAYYSALEEAAEASAERLADAQSSLTSYWMSLAEQNLSNAQEMLRSAFGAEKASITSSYNEQIASLNESLKNTQTIISGLEQNVSRLRSARESMNLVDEAFVKNNYLLAKLQLSMVLQQARTGNLSGIAGLDKTLEVLTGVGPEMYATAADYKRDFYHTYSAIAELEKLAGDQLSAEERMASSIERQIEDAGKWHEQQLASMDKQLNVLLGINTGILSIADATTALAEAEGTAAKGRELDRKSREIYYTGHVGYFGTEAAYAAEIKRKLIENIPFTDPAAAEIFMRDHPELFKTFAEGGLHSGGWRLVGEKGPELEFTGSSKIFDSKKTGSLLNNDALVLELRNLREEVRQGNFQIARNTLKIAKINDRWDADGLPAERTI